jgi:hypothetical protein
MIGVRVDGHGHINWALSLYFLMLVNTTTNVDSYL